ncbi:DUF6838 family protein [Paenibacillus sp. L3-i20]|uniref:phage tail terminator family protein n=1 Tax=Paenibacillus sp. L3-i20 TaxID=2905833 RepID=UPI001EE00944|nr:hypothetical protein [Paenibacillus sp. L3-i20]GKU79860.1 hypothetical protein L3i20_v242570 [Paenibacillus sp. L3-i20]
MSQVTFNEVRYAVHAALDVAFPLMPIFDEEIKQGLKPPGFFVKLLEPSHSHELNNRYMRYHPLDIHYFADGRKNDDMYAMGEQLTSVLELINIGGRSCAGKNMRIVIIEDVLHFFVDYNFKVWRKEPQYPLMQTLEHKEVINP